MTRQVSSQVRSRQSRPLMAMLNGVPGAGSESRPELLSQAEAAFQLGISRTTLWRLIRAGELATVHIGSRSLVTRRSLVAFISRRSSPELD